MTVDIRANVTCSLGTLISGNVNDDYIQGNGLIKTRGSCEIEGIIKPKIGDKVTFTYTPVGGTQTTLPRVLRVVSSFADPLRNTTQVELGCLLTLKQGAAPKPEFDGEAGYTTGDQMQCINGDATYPNGWTLARPLLASEVVNYCASRAGLQVTGANNLLSARYYADKFSLEEGFLEVISGLLQTECCIGVLDASERIQVISLVNNVGTEQGFNVTPATLVDVSPIGVGQLPPDVAITPYQYMRFKDPSAMTDKATNPVTNEEEGDIETIEVKFEGGSTTASYNPRTETITTYGEAPDYGSGTCVIPSSLNKADLSNSIIKRETRERVCLGFVANSYAAELLSAGKDPTVNGVSNVITTEEFEFDKQGRQTRVIRQRWEPFFMFAGRLDIDFVYGKEDADNTTGGGDGTTGNDPAWGGPTGSGGASDGMSWISLGSELVLVEETVEEINYADGDPGGVSTVTTTSTVKRGYGLTQYGQQAVAEIKETSPFTNAADALSFLQVLSGKIVVDDITKRVDRARVPADSGEGSRVDDWIRINTQDGKRLQAAVELQLGNITGSNDASRSEVFSMPYSPDNYVRADLKKSEEYQKNFASNYAETQVKLLYGQRYGINMQVDPKVMKGRAFSAIYLTLGGISGAYRVNGASWSFNRDGVIASVDALYWGYAGGGSGTRAGSVTQAWFPKLNESVYLPAPTIVEDPTLGSLCTPTAVQPPYTLAKPVDAGIQLGLNVVSTKKQAFTTTTTVEVGIELGLYVSLPSIEIVEVGIALGQVVTVSTTTNTIETVEIGVALGVAASYPPGPELLRVNANGADGSTAFTDESSYGRALTATNVDIQGNAMNFNVPGDGYISVADPSNDFAFGTGAFTIEFFVNYKGQANPQISTIVSSGPDLAADQQWRLSLHEEGSGRFRFLWGSASQVQSDLDPSDGIRDLGWAHVAFVREDSLPNGWQFYLNGVRSTDLTFGTHTGPSLVGVDLPGYSNLFIGGASDASSGGVPDTGQFNIHSLDSLIITKGIGKYLANFTPPART